MTQTKPLQIKRHTDVSGEPANGDLAYGELRVNAAANKLWVGDAAGNPVWLNSPNPGALGFAEMQYRAKLPATATPAASFISTDVDDPTLVRTLYINIVDDMANDISVYLAEMGTGQTLSLQLKDDPTQYVKYAVREPVVLTGNVYEVAVNFVEQVGAAFIDNQRLRVSWRVLTKISNVRRVRYSIPTNGTDIEHIFQTNVRLTKITITGAGGAGGAAWNATGSFPVIGGGGGGAGTIETVWFPPPINAGGTGFANAYVTIGNGGSGGSGAGGSAEQTKVRLPWNVDFAIINGGTGGGLNDRSAYGVPGIRGTVPTRPTPLGIANTIFTGGNGFAGTSNNEGGPDRQIIGGAGGLSRYAGLIGPFGLSSGGSDAGATGAGGNGGTSFNGTSGVMNGGDGGNGHVIIEEELDG